MEVGETVFADFGRYSSIDVRKGKVERITPTGQVVINFAGHVYKFRDGRQITTDPWYKARILDAGDAHELLETQRERGVRKQIRAVLDDIKSTRPKAEILKDLARAKSLVESLPDDT